VKEGQRKKLNRMIWRQRFRAALPLAGAFAIFLVLAAVFWFDPSEPVAQVTGTVVGIRKPQDDVWRPSRLVVTLNSGQTVTVGDTDHLRFQPGRSVILQEYVSQVFGRRSYRFVAYEED